MHLNINDPAQINYTVGTLNYSCSIVSPYEFHQSENKDNSLFEFQFNDAFREFALKEFPDFDEPSFQWEMTALDLAWKDRWSPFYKEQCGAGPNGKLLNEQEFIEQWNRHMEMQKKQILEQGVQRLTLKGSKLSKEQLITLLERQISLCRQYDLIGYKGIIKVLYGVKDIKNINLSSDIYLSERKKHFNKVYLREQDKEQRTLQMIQQKGYDIFTLQEVSKRFIEILKKKLLSYVVVEMPDKLSQICNSLILVKKTKFPGQTAQSIQKRRDKFLEDFAKRRRNPGDFSKKSHNDAVLQANKKMVDQSQQQADLQNAKLQIHKQLFWNDDTCYCIVGPLIIFSPHISTKVGFNEQQINHIKDTITQIVTYFPDEYFICAGDLNGDFDNQLNFKTPDRRFIKVNAFPYHEEDVTCYKMRTMTQAQKSKALEISFCKKDYIITDLRICDPAVIMADGTIVNKNNAPLIPNQRHPFDHFIVVGTIRMIDRVISSSPLLKKDRLSKPFSMDYLN